MKRALTALLTAACLATLPGCNYPTDVEASLRWFKDDLIDPVLTVTDGMLQMPGGPGLGYRIDPAKLKRYLVQEETL